jgi:hypothetical protein
MERCVETGKRMEGPAAKIIDRSQVMWDSC